MKKDILQNCVDVFIFGRSWAKCLILVDSCLIFKGSPLQARLQKSKSIWPKNDNGCVPCLYMKKQQRCASVQNSVFEIQRRKLCIDNSLLAPAVVRLPLIRRQTQHSGRAGCLQGASRMATRHPCIEHWSGAGRACRAATGCRAFCSHGWEHRQWGGLAGSWPAAAGARHQGPRLRAVHWG